MEELRTIILTIGIQGSGKSSWAKEQLTRYPGKYKRINKDDLRAMLDNNVWDFKNEKFVLGLRDTIAERALFRGHDVIIDDTNFSDKHWGAMCNIAKRIGNVRVMEKFFDCPIEEAVRRNALRPNPVPEGVIRKLYADKVKGKHIQVRDEYFPKNNPQFMSINDTKQKAVIIDMDGTLALACDRSYYDMTKILGDAPNEPICELARILKSKGYWIIIVSGRDDSCKIDTETWLKCNNIPYDIIHMRKLGDSRKDSVIKQEIYNEHIKSLFNAVYCVDDRDSVVSMWRDIGLTCLQVNFGGF